MNPAKVGRPSKGALTCFGCKNTCLPKNGDWFVLEANVGQQKFFCRSCERQPLGGYKRAIPTR